ncbi:MAG TPA: hypothetical protein DIT05_18810 [Morganella sp. (in: Bacteria)]|nr:hypothetical protein [Morganella sp. (in: enterobacteria)]
MQWWSGLVLIMVLFLQGCTPDDPPKEKIAYVGANLLGYNHVAGTNINWFSVNGQRGRTGGFTCCVMLPEKWQPNMKVDVQWEVNPDPFPMDLPEFNDPNYNNYMKNKKANYRQYRTTTTIPEYDDSCGLQVHFLPCQQVKVTATCYGINHPDHPVKDPFDQPEPAQCPQ